MTTVLPDPVAILRAIRGSPGFDLSLAARRSFSIQASPYLRATSAIEQPRRGRCDAHMTPAPPLTDPLTNEIDEAVLLDPIARPLGLELKLPAFLLWLRDRDEEELVRRFSTISSVMPPSVNRKCREGSANAEFKIGFSIMT